MHMKKRMIAAITIVLVAVCLCATAGANSWGLKGDLYRAVEQAKTWDDYTLLGNQAGDFAVLTSRYHNALFYADLGNDLHVYTEAVYQPEDKKPAPKLEMDDDFNLTISYGEDESYVFLDTLDGYELSEATIGDFHMEMYDPEDSVYAWNYSGADGEGTAVYPYVIMLDTFNIKLFPHSAAQVRNINRMQTLLGYTRYCLGYGTPGADAYSADNRGELLEPKKNGTAAVYSAPSEKAWRAGKGKAAVGLSGSLWVLEKATMGDGRAWACIRYDVSERTQRIGWTPCDGIGLKGTDVKPEGDLYFVRTKAETVANTYLTDDPDVSQFAQFSVPAGTTLTCLGLYNDYYAYVEAGEKNGKLTGGGNTIRGFVPLRDLQPAPKAAQKNVMKEISGTWYQESGGTLAGDVLTLDAGGTFSCGMSGSPDDEPETLEGIWFVTNYDPAEDLYWDEPGYEMTLLYDTGIADIYGLSWSESNLSLTTRESGGSYTRDPDGIPEWEIYEDYDEE